VQILSNYMKETNIVGVQLTFNDLQVATERLGRVLLNNPHLSSTQFSQVLDMYQVDLLEESNKNLGKLISDTYSISCSKGTFHTLSSIKDKLESDKSIGRSEGTYLDICAKLFWAEIGKLMAKQKGLLHVSFRYSHNRCFFQNCYEVNHIILVFTTCMYCEKGFAQQMLSASFLQRFRMICLSLKKELIFLQRVMKLSKKLNH
jgi:hypothetical protein